MDNFKDYGKRIGKAGPRRCHLTADTLGELHGFAERIGLCREWFQEGTKPHYDIGTERVRQAAIEAGAVVVSTRDIVRLGRANADSY